jgi:hypothetical protein
VRSYPPFARLVADGAALASFETRFKTGFGGVELFESGCCYSLPGSPSAAIGNGACPGGCILSHSSAAAELLDVKAEANDVLGRRRIERVPAGIGGQP